MVNINGKQYICIAFVRQHFSMSLSPKNAFDCRLDIDECAVEIHNCDAKSDCTNINGSFTCTCKTGYSGNGTSCHGKYVTQHIDRKVVVVGKLDFDIYECEVKISQNMVPRFILRFYI